MAGISVNSSNSINIPADAFHQSAANANAPQLPEIPQAGALVAEASNGNRSPSLSGRTVGQLSTSAFDGLGHLDSGTLEHIRHAKSPAEARQSVGIWNRILDFILPKMLRSSASEAAEQVFNAIYDKSPTESFQLLRMMFRPEERHHLKLEMTSDGQAALKVGKFTLNSADIDSPATKQKIEDTLIGAKASDILAKRNPPVDAESELQEIANSFPDKNTWEKFEDIAKLVLSKTSPDDCWNCPVELQKSESPPDNNKASSESYNFSIDGQLVSSSPANSRNDQVLAAKSQINMRALNSLRSTAEARSLESFRAANIQCMADAPEMQKQINSLLDDSICQAGNLVSIADIKGEPIFRATFRDADSGREVSFDFSNRSSTNFELRSERLKQALQDPDYRSLRDLTEHDHGSSNDVMLKYAIAPIREDIDNAVDSIAPDGITASRLKEVEAQLQAAETNKADSLKALKSANRRLAHYTSRSKTPSKEVMRSVKTSKSSYQKAETALVAAQVEAQAEAAASRVRLRAEILQGINLENTTIGQLLYGDK